MTNADPGGLACQGLRLHALRHHLREAISYIVLLAGLAHTATLPSIACLTV